LAGATLGAGFFVTGAAFFGATLGAAALAGGVFLVVDDFANEQQPPRGNGAENGQNLGECIT
jgi:hypothetical protein